MTVLVNGLRRLKKLQEKRRSSTKREVDGTVVDNAWQLGSERRHKKNQNLEQYREDLAASAKEFGLRLDQKTVKRWRARQCRQ